MGNRRGLGLHLIFVSVFLSATTYSCLGVRNTSVVCFEEERLALLKFKESVQDDFGMLSSWVGNDCCRWGRIKCHSVTGHVESLHLRGDSEFDLLLKRFYLIGNEVSSSLADLKHLRYLDMSWNDFQGSRIPEFIGSLKQLTYLNLSKGGFQGFWGVIGVLLFKKQWRQKLFMFAEETMDKIYVAVMVRVAKMKRGREAA